MGTTTIKFFVRQRFVLVAAFLAAHVAYAGDWPQVLGPQRNGIAENESLADAWPASGPKTLWSREVGSGFAGVAVVGETGILFHRVGDQERVEAIDVAIGKSLWKNDHVSDFVPSYTSDDGPRCVPIKHKGRVYVYGAMGVLRCIDAKSGQSLWVRDTFKDYSSKRRVRGEPAEGYFGIGSGPIVEGNLLLVNVGGDEANAGLVAFNLETGKTVWKSTTERASYSSPVAATIDGVRHVVFAARFHVVSVDPANGAERFRFEFGEAGPNVTAANPVVLGNQLFISASYGFGAVFAKVGKSGVDELWRSDDVMSSQYTTCIAHEGNLYGIHGRQDIGTAALRCFNPQTREIRWTKDGLGYATLIKADDKLVILKTDGELILAELNSQRYRELARTRLFNSETRALPALASGRLYARDGQTLKCVSLR